MDVLAFLAVLVLLALVVALVTGPLRGGRPEAELVRAEGRREELEAAKEAKYREIRDLELDRRMGKLAEDDFRQLDRQLRGEAVAILRELDELP